MPSPKRWRSRHVAVFIESAREPGRRMLQGIARYNAEHGGRWTIYFEPRSAEAAPPHWLCGWQGDGILARISTRQQVAAFQATGLPVIDLRGAVAGTPFPAILGDNRQVAHLAFTHFRERGLTHFAYCGLSPSQHWHQSQRGEEFCRVVEAAGFSCALYQFQKKQDDWEQEQDQLADWLAAQTKPLGVFACFDDYGYQVLDACRRAG